MNTLKLSGYVPDCHLRFESDKVPDLFEEIVFCQNNLMRFAKERRGNVSRWGKIQNAQDMKISPKRNAKARQGIFNFTPSLDSGKRQTPIESLLHFLPSIWP
jgi:hypothetical protein